MPDRIEAITVGDDEVLALESELAKGRQYLNELNAKANELSVNLFRLEGAIGFLRGKQQQAAGAEPQPTT